MDEYRNIHGKAVDLTGGRFVAPEETVKLSAEELKDPHNASLVEEGKLLKLPAKSKGGDK